MKYLFVISSVLFFSYPVFSKAGDDLPFYEKCNWKNEELTNQIVKKSKQFFPGSTQAKSLCVECKKNQELELKTVRYLLHVMDRAGEIPPICFLAAGLRSVGVHQSKKPNKKSYHYCSNSKAPKPEPFMTFSQCKKSGAESYCLNKQNKKKYAKKIYPHKPCLNADYIKTTAKAFNEMADCFGFSSLENKRYLFALFNHQSSFLLNKRGSTDADSQQQSSCYGQVSNQQIMDINVDIRYPPETWGGSSGHHIYRGVIRKCPHLKNRIPLLKFCRKGRKKSQSVENKRKQYRECLKNNHRDAISCNVSYNPYSCLFYAMFQIQKDKSDFAMDTTRMDLTLSEMYKKNLDDLKSKKRDLTFFEKLATYLGIDVVGRMERQRKQYLQVTRLLTKTFKLPVLSNELLTVHVDTYHKRRGKQKVKRTFQTLAEVYTFFTDPNLFYDKESLTIKKVKVFNEPDLNWGFMYLLRQHGLRSSVKNQIPYFMGYAKNRVRTDKKYKDSILSGSSLKLSDLDKEFTEYANKYAKDIYGEHKSHGVIKEINNNLGYLFNKNNQLKKDLKSIHRTNPLTDGQVDRFLQQVRFSCPTGLY